MKNVSDNLESLVSCSHELLASAVVNMLEDHGIKARAVGGYTSGFKAEAPGLVDVLVMSDDLERAKAALHRMHDNEAVIDWSEPMVGDVEDLSDECIPGTRPSGRRKMIIYAGLALFILWSLKGYVFSG